MPKHFFKEIKNLFFEVLEQGLQKKFIFDRRNKNKKEENMQQSWIVKINGSYFFLMRRLCDMKDDKFIVKNILSKRIISVWSILLTDGSFFKKKVQVFF